MALRLSGLQNRANRRPDKAFMPPSGNLRLTQCLMALRLSSLQKRANRRPDKAVTPPSGNQRLRLRNKPNRFVHFLQGF